MDADLDTLATALYVKIDDLLTDSPQHAPWRPRVGIAPQISDAELATLCVMQALLSFTSEARWLRHARAHLQHLFPYLPHQPGYNKRLRKLARTVNWVIRQLATDTSIWSDDVWVVDSTPIECARSRDVVRGSDLAGWARHGAPSITDPSLPWRACGGSMYGRAATSGGYRSRSTNSSRTSMVAPRSRRVWANFNPARPMAVRRTSSERS
jgi:hypothetical protein